MTSYLVMVVNLFADLMELAIIFRVIMSWFKVGGYSTTSKLKYFIDDVTEPVMRVAAKVTPRTGMIDFSPLIAVMGLELIRMIITAILM